MKSLYIDFTLDLSELDVCSHPVLQKIITSIEKFKEERETRKLKMINRDILLCLLLQFKPHTLESANFNAGFCFIFAGFIQIENFTNVDRGE